MAALVSAYAVSSTRRAPGIHVQGLLQELDAVHLRHPVVGEDHRHQVAAQLQFAQRLKCRLAGLRAHDPVRGAVAASEVARDGAGDPRIVVHGHDDGARSLRDFSHTSSPTPSVVPAARVPVATPDPAPS
jgi:hypothetical protein